MIAAIIVSAGAVFLFALMLFSEKSARRPLGEGLVLLCIGAIALAIVAIPVGLLVSSATIDERAQAEAAAKTWASSLGYTDVRVTCASRDTNGDGYVSCTVAGSRDGRGEVIPVECARSVMTWNDGCRVQKLGEMYQ